jgi:peptidoglycan/xylan/chitin deacetylase (PgdA/CDA1 family)
MFFKIDALEARIDSMEMSRNEISTEAVSGPALISDDPVSGAAVSGAAVEKEKPGKGKKVYLTFDDGPGPNTEKILDILKKNDIKATFFVTGKTDDFSKQMYKRIVEEGHTLGMHSYSHVYDEIYASEKAFSQDFDKLYEFLHDVTGEYSKFYRFPGGSSVQDTKVPIKKLVKFLDKKEITYLDWNVLSPDIKDANVSKKQLLKELRKEVKKYDTSVVVFYDTQTQPMTIKALPSVIKALKKDEYEILPVDENTAPIRHNQ